MSKGLFPAAPSVVKPNAPAPDTADAFHDELVRRRGDALAERPEARAEEARAEEARASRQAKAQRAGRRKPDAVSRKRGGTPTSEDAPVTSEQASPADRTDASKAAATAEAAPAEDADALRGDGVADPAPETTDAEPSEVEAALAATTGLAAAAHGPALPGDVRAYSGEGAAEIYDGALEVEPLGLRPAVYHAPAGEDLDVPPGTDDATPDATNATGGASLALFEDAPAEPGDGDAEQSAAQHRRAGDAASAALLDGTDGTDGTGPRAASEPGAETAPAPARTEPLPSLAATTTGLEPRAETRAATAPSAPAPSLPATPPEVRFAAANHENIVTSMRSELLPNGGAMRIRLDPPQLGALQVTVEIRDGLITAAFETSSDEATRLLGHSLNHLKSVLESQGVAVDKLQVQQAPREATAQNASDEQRREQGGQSPEQEQSARQEQQRREMLRRMWRRLAGGQDPLDLTA